MILGSLKNTKRIEPLNPFLKAAFDYVRTHDLTSVPAGKIVIVEGDCWINVVDHPGKTMETATLESHNHFLDVHIPLSAPETLGWIAREDKEKEGIPPYDEAGDGSVYPGPGEIYTKIQPGEFVIYWPEDVHAPAIADGPFRKLIVKARCD